MTQTAIWRFDGWNANDQYLIALQDRITDVEGYQLDRWIKGVKGLCCA